MESEPKHVEANQVIWIKVLSICFVIANTTILVTAMHNILRYMCKLKIKKFLIIGYYVCTCVSSSFIIVSFTYIFINPLRQYNSDMWQDT